MPEDRNLKERLVAGVERDGRRRRFDPQAKREPVQVCLQPGVSVAPYCARARAKREPAAQVDQPIRTAGRRLWCK
jgi:hypothetical protein